jgi:hypothetical protein
MIFGIGDHLQLVKLLTVANYSTKPEKGLTNYGFLFNKFCYKL